MNDQLDEVQNRITEEVLHRAELARQERAQSKTKRLLPTALYRFATFGSTTVRKIAYKYQYWHDSSYGKEFGEWKPDEMKEALLDLAAHALVGAELLEKGEFATYE
jgi:hypothetical protein